MKAPVIKELVGNKPRKLCLVNLKRVIELDSIAIAPGINLRVSPAPLKPVASIQSEFSERYANVGPESHAFFALVAAIWGPGVAMKIQGLQRDVFLRRMINPDSPALI